MSAQLLTGNRAAAWGARLAGVDYVPAFPITPQTEIIESIGAWIDTGEIPARMVTLESEHSMLTAAGAAAATGVRVFSATSSRGLLHAMEMMYIVAGWRAPFVLVNVSRGLSAPITLEADHNDVLAARDSGFLQLHCASCQEVVDCILLAYRLGEDERVRLPAIVNLDGFYLSFTREPVTLPTAGMVRDFLPAFDPDRLQFSASAPESQAVAVLGGGPCSYFRYDAHLASLAASRVVDEAAADYSALTGRSLDAVEAYRAGDAEIVYFMMGLFASKAREVVDRLRDAGQRVGLLRPRLLRPFPEDRLRDLLAGRRAVIVVDQNLSVGKGGVLHAELCSVLHGRSDSPGLVSSYIGGLGGPDITIEELFEMVSVTRKALANGEIPPPRLLYTSDEMREIRKLQAIALVKRSETASPRQDDGAQTGD